LERAYRQHVAVIHPDKFFGDPRRHELAQAKLKELNAAMEVLRDRVQRARYDARLRGNCPSSTPLASRLGGALRPGVA
jgi:curved DNA-binding protein CbpA